MAEIQGLPPSEGSYGSSGLSAAAQSYAQELATGAQNLAKSLEKMKEAPQEAESGTFSTEVTSQVQNFVTPYQDVTSKLNNDEGYKLKSIGQSFYENVLNQDVGGSTMISAATDKSSMTNYLGSLNAEQTDQFLQEAQDAAANYRRVSES